MAQRHLVYFYHVTRELHSDWMKHLCDNGLFIMLSVSALHLTLIFYSCITLRYNKNTFMHDTESYPGILSKFKVQTEHAKIAKFRVRIVNLHMCNSFASLSLREERAM